MALCLLLVYPHSQPFSESQYTTKGLYKRNKTTSKGSKTPTDRQIDSTGARERKNLETSSMSSNPLIRMHSDFNSDSNFDFSFFSSALQVLVPSNSFHGSPFFNSFGHVLIWLQRDRVCERESDRERGREKQVWARLRIVYASRH